MRRGRPTAAAGLWCLLATTGCGIGTTYWPTDADYQAFVAAGPIEPALDRDRLLAGLPTPGPYRVVPGDLLRVRGAGELLAGDGGELLTRVRDDWTIQLPLAGDISVLESDREESTGEEAPRGMPLLQIEATIAAALYPRLLAQRPAIVVEVREHHTVKVAVLGAVEQPGVHALPSDRMSLYGALTEAGGILRASNLEVGARTIRIRRPGEDRPTALALPVVGLNVPYADVALRGGETIEVERWEPELFTVVGLVAKPGAYEYPPGGSYNLMQALAVAGGVDRIADPPYATVFRKAEDGEIVAATFGISGRPADRASQLEIRPGDVISVDHTTGSWTRSLIAAVLRLQVNFFVDPLDTR